MYQRQIKTISSSFQGRDRKTNKDGILLISDDNYHIVGVLDGVSSATGAKEAVNYAIKYINNNHNSFFKEGAFDLSGMLEKLNRALNATKIGDPFTTCSLAYVPHESSQKITMLSMGDSRIYSVSNQYLFQLTTDHNDPIRTNVLTKYLGERDLTLKDFEEIEYIESKDEQGLLICSDGFYSVMESSPKNLAELHRVLNLKAVHFIQNGVDKVIYGHNADDASYIFVRWKDV